MSAKPIKTLDVRSRAQWHAWLEKHHASVAEIWLVFHKERTGTKGVDREASVEEALCFGWIDSLVRRIDDERYAVKFTPRKPDSRWSDVNRRRYASLEKRGLLTRRSRPTSSAHSRPSRPRGGSSGRSRRRIGVPMSVGSTPRSATRRRSGASSRPSSGLRGARGSD